MLRLYSVIIGHAINSTVQIAKANNVFDIIGGRKNTPAAIGIYVGGLVGYADTNSKVELTTSYNLGTIKAIDKYGVAAGTAGGLVGYVEGSIGINQCYNTAAVIGKFASGMIGQADSAVISISYAYINP